MISFTLIVGLLSQLCYGMRQLVQWVMTERLKRVVSPTGYWAFSLAGCCFMLTYGWLREDIVILVGQMLSFYVYVLNLDYKGAWRLIPRPIRIVLYCVPVIALIATAMNAPHLVDRFIHNPDIPLWLMIYGTCAQLIFLSRYAYQVVYSVKRHESCLPPVFWLISIIGASLTLVYGIIRLDPILMLGQSISILIFSRNLWVGWRYSKNQELHSDRSDGSDWSDKSDKSDTSEMPEKP